MPESLRLLSLIPAPGLEDLPLQLSGGAADDLLVTLTALWQPALIAAAESIPGWGRADQPPEAATPILAVVPPAAADRLPAGCEDRIRQAQGELWRADLGLERIAEEAIRRFGHLPAAGDDPELRDLAADFFALGFAYWQAQLLCRQQRHSWQLDDDPFRAAVVAAAVAWREANAAATCDGLQSAFDLLTQARIRHFPIDPHLVDLILTAPTTLDERLAKNLAEPGPLNLLICGELAQRLASTRPEIAEQVRAHLADGSLSIVGGPEHEWPWQLFPLERLRAEIACGHDRYSAAFGQRPRIYGQRQYGLAAALPTLLSSFGYRGVLHASFDGSSLPDSGAALAQWRAEDGSSVHAVWGPPLDAERGEPFLGLSRRLGRALDSAHCAVAVLAHWPGRGSPWLRLLRRTAAYGRLLGRFVALEQLLEQLSAYGHHPIPEPQGYYVETWAEAANDRRWRPEVIAGHWRDHYQRLAAHGCDLMARLAGPCGRGWRRCPTRSFDNLPLVASSPFGGAVARSDCRGMRRAGSAAGARQSARLRSPRRVRGSGRVRGGPGRIPDLRGGRDGWSRPPGRRPPFLRLCPHRPKRCPAARPPARAVAGRRLDDAERVLRTARRSGERRVAVVARGRAKTDPPLPTVGHSCGISIGRGADSARRLLGSVHADGGRSHRDGDGGLGGGGDCRCAAG